MGIKIKNSIKRECKKCNKDCSYIYDKKARKECVNVCINRGFK